MIRHRHLSAYGEDRKEILRVHIQDLVKLAIAYPHGLLHLTPCY